MKPVFYFIILVLLQNCAYSQMPADWGAFNQRLNAKPYRGKNFRVQAAVRIQAIDSSAEGEIWVRVDRPKKKMGFFYNMMDKPIRSNEWKVYDIEGKIDKDAEWISFGGLYHRKGLFYFDEFKFFVEGEDKKMMEVPIGENSFEGDMTSIKQHWGFLREMDGFVAGPVEDKSYSGKQSFLIDGSAFVPPKTYGSNSDAGRFADVNGIRLYYETYGEGEPLLLLHGNSESIASFSKQIPELSRHFKIIAVDSRGQGKSTEDGKKFTYELFAEDTKALLDHLNLDSVSILGWSDGGNTGLIMAMQYPARVKQLAVMGANIYNNTSSVKPWVNNLLNKRMAELKDSTHHSIFTRRMITLLLTEPNISETALQKITCPVLVMAGSNDVIKESHTKLIAKNIKQSKLVIFPKGNHYEPSQRPARFNKTVLEFLEGS